jgi:PAS domain S-box-containing protein
MTKKTGAAKRSMREMDELQSRLQEAEDTLSAIYSGEVDAVVVSGPDGDQIFTLEGAEHPYRVLVEEMSEGAVTLNPEGMILYCNRRFAEMVRAPLETVIGAGIYQFLPQADRRPFEALLKEAMAGSSKIELSLRGSRTTPAGTPDSRRPIPGIPVYLSASPLRIDDTQAICLIVTDLTEQKQSEEMVAAGKRRLEEELLKANKLESIGVLAGGLAHDLNNSLTAILGNISLAKKSTKADDEQFKRLAEAESACLRARDVTQQLLTFSTGGAPVRREVPIAPLLREWTGFALSGANVICELHMPDDLWCADIDEGQISRVINNLVINAQQAMPEGGTISIKAENTTVDPDEQMTGLPLPGGNYIKIDVQDQGTGIPEAHLARIFDPYFTTKQKGSGLGLSIAYSVTKSHNGYIAVDSKLGVGTTFHIYLPSTGRQATAPEEEPANSKGGSLRVLVMDDQESIRDLISAVLTDLEDNEVEFANDGLSAIELYKQAKEQGRPFDVVMMDLTIPGGMGGEEAIKKLREIDPHTRAIVISGYSNDPIMADFTKHGFDGVIRKPFEIDELIDTLYGVAGSRGHGLGHVVAGKR